MTSDPTSAAATAESVTSAAAPVSSGTPATVVATTGLMIEEFVFRQPPHPLPTGSETDKRKKYSEAAEWGATEVLDRRLRERVVVTFKAVNTNNDVEYKMYLVKEDESDVAVTYDTSSSEPKFTFFKEDKFYTMSTPEGQHFWQLWTRKYKDLEKLDLIEAGKYKVKMVTKDKDDNEKTWFSSNTLEVKYDPFKVLIVTTPMTDTEIENEKVDGHLINDKGKRIFKDSFLRVYRGAHTSASSDAVLVGTFKGMTMPTSTDAGGNIATPKGTYFGFKDLHSGSYDCVELEDVKRASGEGVIMLPAGINNNPVSTAPNYPSGKNYKDHVQIHKNPNTNQTWISTGLSHGCIVVSKSVYGSVNDTFKNRQNNSSAVAPEDNSSKLLAAIFGGHETKAIPKKSDHKRKLDIQVILQEATGTSYAAYRTMYTGIIQEVKIEPDGDKFKISFRVPRGIYRDFKGAQRHFKISGNTKYKWYIAKKESDGKITALRTVVGGSGFTNLTAGEHDWVWDGYDKAAGATDRKREAGTYYCVIETKFDPGLTGTDAIDEEKVLDDDGKMGTAWNYPITVT